MAVEGKTHSEVVAAIKAGGSVTKLLVVDPDADAFFKRCRVVPSLDHITGESRLLLFCFSSSYLRLWPPCERDEQEGD